MDARACWENWSDSHSYIRSTCTGSLWAEDSQETYQERQVALLCENAAFVQASVPRFAVRSSDVSLCFWIILFLASWLSHKLHKLGFVCRGSTGNKIAVELQSVLPFLWVHAESSLGNSHECLAMLTYAIATYPLIWDKDAHQPLLLIASLVKKAYSKLAEAIVSDLGGVLSCTPPPCPLLPFSFLPSQMCQCWTRLYATMDAQFYNITN